MPKRSICCPWEDGALSSLPLFKAFPQKTIKTRCGRRTKFAKTSAEAPTCPACLEHIERQKIGLQMIRQYAADTLDYGPDVANARAEAFAKEHGLGL